MQLRKIFYVVEKVFKQQISPPPPYFAFKLNLNLEVITPDDLLLLQLLQHRNSNECDMFIYPLFLLLVKTESFRYKIYYFIELLILSSQLAETLSSSFYFGLGC